jgi:hypothetical protein
LNDMPQRAPPTVPRVVPRGWLPQKSVTRHCTNDPLLV